MTVCQTSHVFYDLDSVEEYWSYTFLGNLSNEIFLSFFSWLDWDYGFGGGKPHRWIIILVISYQGCMLSTWMITIYMSHHRMAEVVFVMFPHCKAIPFSHFPYCPLWYKVTMCSPHLKSRMLCSTSLGMEYLHRCFGIHLLGKFVLVYSYLFIPQLFISVWKSGLLILYFGL